MIARAHHGSVSKEQRALIEDDLKRGRLPCVVATSSLELGIDMGAVDLVVQIESPPSVASALQRVGRAGHQVGEVSRGVLLPKHRGDLVQTAVAVERMRSGAIEALHVPANPLDVLAQHVVAATAVDEWDVDALFALVRRSAPFATLPRSAYDATLDLLSGRYPSDEFRELRPRVVWDRVAGTLTARPGAQRLAVTSGGTIPDRGLFGVFLVGEKQSRVGELDEEMVYESRVGDVFALGATSWRIEDITHDRVLVSPAPGQPGRLPFWKGDQLGRPAELGAAIGAFTRELSALTTEQAKQRCTDAGLDAWAADNLVAFLDEQREATSTMPTDRTVLVERFRDELGDWRIVIHSPYGAQVHAPWALAIGVRLRERYGIDAQALPGDDGIVLRVPETDQDPPGGDVVVFDPDEIEDIVTSEVGGSALFASRFRECAARALLLPRRDPGRRSPLWQQRQRSAQLLEVAVKYPSFPIVLEAVRECLQDVYDVPALLQMMRDLSSRRIRVVEVSTNQPSPFARSLLFGYVAAFMYEGDSPVAERRAAALSLDQGLLAELLGRAELRELLDPAVLAELELELQRLTPDRRARDAEGVADLLRLLGPLSTSEVTARAVEGADAASWLALLADARRVVEVRMGGEARWTAVEDVARLRDALGVPVPPGTPEVFTESVEDPLADLVARFARTHGPFTPADVAQRLGLGVAVAAQTLARLGAQGRVLEGEFRPAGAGAEWCDAEVLRRLRRRSLAALRKEVEPVETETLGRFLPVWQNVGGRLRGVGRRAHRGRPAGRLRRARVGAGAAGPRQPGRGLPALDARRAHRRRRGAVGRTRHAAGHRRLGIPAPRRHGAPDTARPARARHDAAARRRGRGAGRRRGVLLPAARHHGRLERRQGPRSRPVGPGVGGPAQQRHPRARPGPDLRRPDRAPDPSSPAADPVGVVAQRRQGPPGPTVPHRSADHGRPLVVAARPRDRRHPPRPRQRRGAARTARRGHAWRGDERTRARWLRRRLQGALRLRGLRALPPRVLRELARRRPVRRPRSRRPAALLLPGGGGRPDDEKVRSVALAATDPANPYGAALPWPERIAADEATGTGHRPGRKAGALVVMVDGALSVYVERGGRTLLTFTDDVEALAPAMGALATAVRQGALGRLTVEKADGLTILGTGERSSALRQALEQAGFVATPRGLRLRG